MGERRASLAGVSVRGVLLDLDGTLLDHEGAVREALHGWLPALGVAVTPAVHARWTAITERHLADWRHGRVDFAGQRRRRVAEFLPSVGVPVGADDAARDAAFDGYLRWYQRYWRAFDDVHPALAALGAAGLRTAVLTNGALAQQRRKLAAIGVLDTVGPLFAADDLGHAKPSTGAYHVACARWGLRPDEV